MALIRRVCLSCLILLLAACASTVPLTPPTPAYHASGAGTRLQARIAPMLDAHPGQSGGALIPDNDGALLSRLALLMRAEREVDLQYYIWHNDRSGLMMVDALKEAAERGVRVRVLLDDTAALGQEGVLRALDGYRNIEIRLFNPFGSRGAAGLRHGIEFLFKPSLNRRMHNKLFIVDNSVAVLGGRNIGDEYMAGQPDVEFLDIDVLVVGPVVEPLANSFDEFWNSRWAIPAEVIVGAATASDRAEFKQALAAKRAELLTQSVADELRNRLATRDGLPSTIHWGRATAVADSPEKLDEATDNADADRFRLLPKLTPWTRDTRRTLDIVSPYFVPRDDGVAALSTMQQRGVQVTVLTNSLAATDVTAVHAGYAPSRVPLLQAGVRLFELKPTARRAKGKRSFGFSSRASLHAKSMIFDQRAVFIGSLNIDPRSVAINTEVGVVIESESLAKQLLGLFDAAIAPQMSYRLRLDETGKKLQWESDEQGRPMIQTEEPETSIWRRLGVWGLQWLPLDSQL